MFDRNLVTGTVRMSITDYKWFLSLMDLQVLVCLGQYLSVGRVGHCFVNGRLRFGDIEFRFGVTR